MIAKAYYPAIILLSLVLFSCKGDPETLLEVEVNNGTNKMVGLRMFSQSEVSDYADTTIIPLLSGENYKWMHHTKGESSEYPSGLHGNSPPGDSLHIIFNDTLSVTHFTYSAGYHSTHIDSMVIEYDEPRNIYNPNNFNKEELGENYFRGTYIITEADLDYALSIHE